MVLFEKGHDNVFLGALGIHYGYIYTGKELETVAIPAILDIENGLAIIRSLEKDLFFTTNDAQTIERSMAEAGLLNTQLDVFRKARQFIMPTGFSATLGFRVCGCISPRVTHGHVTVEKTNYTVSRVITSLAMGFSHCDNMVRNNGVTTLNAITVFKQMLAADWPADNK